MTAFDLYNVSLGFVYETRLCLLLHAAQSPRSKIGSIAPATWSVTVPPLVPRANKLVHLVCICRHQGRGPRGRAKSHGKPMSRYSMSIVQFGQVIVEQDLYPYDGVVEKLKRSEPFN